jgi:hypothetical protein
MRNYNLNKGVDMLLHKAGDNLDTAFKPENMNLLDNRNYPFFLLLSTIALSFMALVMELIEFRKDVSVYLRHKFGD